MKGATMGKTSKTSMTKIDHNPTLAPSIGADMGPEELGIVTAESLAAKGYRITRDIKLEAGQGFEGIYEGEGGTVEVADPATGELRPVPSFLFSRGNLRIRLLGASMLVRKLAEVNIGDRVAVVNLGQTTTRAGRRLTVYDVGVMPE